ncbi:hypothetical protein GCM10009760_06310 [Kitasatospora kazusensis]|uniref:Uncharacterized protein n=1 Tax=Kitasatospora kazusensis TaxID=407974 RepID=A0ABP5KK28_9ACTN
MEGAPAGRPASSPPPAAGAEEEAEAEGTGEGDAEDSEDEETAGDGEGDDGAGEVGGAAVAVGIREAVLAAGERAVKAVAWLVSVSIPAIAAMTASTSAEVNATGRCITRRAFR